MYTDKLPPLFCIGESCLIFSTLRPVLSGALRTGYQTFVLTSNAVVSLCEGELGDLGIFSKYEVFHNVVNCVYTQIMSLLRGQISVNVTLVLI